MNNRIGVFPGQGRQHYNTDAPVLFQRSGNITRAAVNGNAMASHYQTRSALLGESFKTAVTGRDPASSDDGDVQYRFLDSIS